MGTVSMEMSVRTYMIMEMSSMITRAEDAVPKRNQNKCVAVAWRKKVKANQRPMYASFSCRTDADLEDTARMTTLI